MSRILILGGTGRIGNSVARDILAHTTGEITVTGRRTPPENAFAGDRVRFLPLSLADETALGEAISGHDLVIHCAGPFRDRDRRVLEICIHQGKNYLDVSDDPPFVREALSLKDTAAANGVTAIVSTGVFPGIANSMARQAVESLDSPDTLRLSYAVAGSGGAGVTVMRTTFLELQHPFDGWIDGKWQSVKPYSEREIVKFPPPYGDAGVYWFHTVEAATLPLSFPHLRSVITKFGSIPDFYNYLTWMVAQLPSGWLKKPEMVEFLSQISYAMTQVTDRLTGVGIAMQLQVTGLKDRQPGRIIATFCHDNTATAAGAGTGSVAELLLSGELQKPGVWPVEQAVTTPLFQRTMQARGMEIQVEFSG
ncbi:MAG: saccharopine dehydrogenase NADP-binding domain-containing protein [Oscillatoriaceae cyanobacterium]